MKYNWVGGGVARSLTPEVTMPTKVDAVRLLMGSGEVQAAKALERWRNRNKQDGGWDKWFMSHNGFPQLEKVLWPRGYRGGEHGR